MPLAEHRRRAHRAGAVVAAAFLLLTGCTADGNTPTPSPTTPTPPRPFTVASTDVVRVTDPAAITDAASAMLSLNVFQRLMTAPPGEATLKPDAARDCLFTSATVYTCTLNRNLTFHNGRPLTSSDVKFSVQRAARLDVPGSSAALLSSLRRIETPDPLTVRFVLSGIDTQFGWALASPAASIVDEETYDADEVRAPAESIVGSGPFSVTGFADGVLSLARFEPYQGYNPALISAIAYRTLPDSASVEDAVAKGEVDVVWRGLNAAAITRYAGQARDNPDELTADGFRMTAFTGLRVQQLTWSPTSRLRANPRLRQAIAVALQGDRTLDSVVPGGVPGRVASFPVGGKASPKVTWKNRIQLSLSYDPSAPDQRDLATQIRTRLEDTGGLSVRLRAGAADVDLTLVDRKAWTATPLAWLQPYLEAPLPASRERVAKLAGQYRETTDPQTAERLLAELQDQAAKDLTVLPISQSDEHLLTRRGAEVSAASFGPGWQLGLFGITGG